MSFGSDARFLVNTKLRFVEAVFGGIFVTNAKNMLNVHMIILIVGLALTALLPVYKPLLKKINTNVEVEGSGDMAAIDISQE